MGAISLGYKKETVLVIDDDPRIADLVAFHLEGVVDTVEVSSTGESGVRLAVQSPPDLVLLDIEMPGIDGFEACRQLKADPTTRDIPIIFLTGDGQTHHKVKALDSGGTDYVTKPFEVVDLQARVRAALRMKRMIDLLRFQAQIDPLTGLGNRAVLDESLAASVAEYQRRGLSFGFCLIDLDHFKKVNDRYGHLAGDEVLRVVGQTVKSHLRPYDVASRFGGEEFSVLLRNLERRDAEEAIARLLDDIRGLRISVLTESIEITASAGLAAYCDTDDHGPALSADVVIRAADMALYEAKDRGRDCLVLADAQKEGTLPGRD